MAKRISGIGVGALKYAPFLAIILAIYQYYKEAGGFQGFLNDIKNISMKDLEAKWTAIGMGVALIVGADVAARYVPGKLKHVVKAIMYYMGAAQLLSVLQGMWVETEDIAVLRTPQMQNGYSGNGYKGGMF